MYITGSTGGGHYVPGVGTIKLRMVVLLSLGDAVVHAFLVMMIRVAPAHVVGANARARPIGLIVALLTSYPTFRWAPSLVLAFATMLLADAGLKALALVGGLVVTLLTSYTAPAPAARSGFLLAHVNVALLAPKIVASFAYN